MPNETCFDGVCWQKKVAISEMEKYLSSGKPKFWEKIDLSLNKSVVKMVSRDTAKRIIEKYEWLGDMAVTDRYYGIFFDEVCAGVICISSNGVFFGNGRLFGIQDKHLSYFARGACVFWAPSGSASRLLSIASRLEANLGQKVCIGFSDISAGEIGTVYQASNWLCLGYTGKTNFVLKSQNDFVDDVTLSAYATRNGLSLGEAKGLFLCKGYELVSKPSKIRYAKILAKGHEYNRIMNKIKHLIVPYPKREQFFNNT